MFFEAGSVPAPPHWIKRFANRVLARLFAQTVRDVRGMTKRAGEVAFRMSASDLCIFGCGRRDEVRKMILAALKGLDFLPFVVIRSAAAT